MSARIAVFLLALLIVLLAGCAPAPTEPALVDSFFSAQAFLDTNKNGKADENDAPVANATFIVTLNGGGEFGDQTDETGRAFITIPGNVEYPVTARMEAPENNPMKLIEPSTVTLSEASGDVKFLFSSK